jgi:signal transduction histidine kinase
VLARQALSGAQRLERVEKRLDLQSVALQRASDQVVEERRDERLSIAAGLHDDVLPPLFKVHLMGQVLRQELATGQLLAMEDDLPELIDATTEASQSLRTQIRNLRSSTIAIHGLPHALRRLVGQLELGSRVGFVTNIEDIDASPVVDLLAYHVAREALRNALKHSNPAHVRVSLVREDESACLVIEDDGCGFAPSEVDETEHFGIALMRERVELAGGILRVDSRRGEGTRVHARLPIRTFNTRVGSE